jgi:hypothetical protein
MRKLIPVAVVVAAAVWSVWPMIKCPDCAANIGRDGLLINWIINTTGKNIYGIFSGGSNGLFGGSIFYPYKNVLAYSDMHSLTALWTYPLAQVWQNPGVVSGLALVAGQVVTMVIIYEWWRKISGNSWGAAVATIAFGLSQIRFEYQVHLQMWSMQYMLIATWLIVSWIDDKSNWKLYAGVVLLGLQVWESLLPIYFAVMVIGIRYLMVRPKTNRREILAAGAVFGIIAAWPLMAYWGVSREFNYQRGIRDAANFSLAVNDVWGQFASPGLYLLLTVAVIRLLSVRTPSNPLLNLRGGSEGGVRKEVRWLGLVMIASLILAFGPVVKWGSKTVKIAGKVPIPLPYAAAYYVVPGYGALRTPSRWIWVAGWAASGLIAVGIGNFQFSIFNLKKATVWGGLLLVAVVAAGGKRTVGVRKIPDLSQTPQVYKWLAGQQGKVIAILPMYPDEREIERLPFSYVHGKYTLNGFSGFYPPPRLEEAARWTAGFPNPETLAEMKAYGTDYIVVEKSQISNPGERSLKVEYEDNNYRVYRL